MITIKKVNKKESNDMLFLVAFLVLAVVLFIFFYIPTLEETGCTINETQASLTEQVLGSNTNTLVSIERVGKKFCTENVVLNQTNCICKVKAEACEKQGLYANILCYDLTFKFPYSEPVDNHSCLDYPYESDCTCPEGYHKLYTGTASYTCLKDFNLTEVKTNGNAS